MKANNFLQYTVKKKLAAAVDRIYYFLHKKTRRFFKVN